MRTSSRSSRRTTLVAALAVTAGVLSTGPLTSFAAAADPLTPVPPVAWADCGDGFECGTLEVPLDHDEPTGPALELAVVRLPAADPSHRVGSVLLNPGGPGGSGVDAVRQDARSLFSDAVRARFDVVGLDLRGVARSAAVRCFPDVEQQQAFGEGRPAFPVGPAETAAFTAGSAELARRCGAQAGDLLAHLSTADSARDLDLLRQALQDEQLSFVGQSYGSFVGQTYAALFPDRVRALVLDGVTDAVAWSTGDPGEAKHTPFSARLGSAEATVDTMGFFLDECQAAGPQGCAFAATDTRQRFEDLLDGLRARPVRLETPGGPLVLTYADVVDGLRGGLQFPPIWPDLAGLLQAVESGQDPAGAAAGLLAAAGSADEPEYDGSADALLATVCADTLNPAKGTAWERSAAKLDRTAPHWGSDWTFLSQPCADWPVVADDRYLGPYDRPLSAAPLLLNAQHDAATPLSGAQAVERRLPGSRLLVLEGAGHPATVTGNGCVLGAMDRYLLDGDLPSAGETCAAEAAPFGTAPSGGGTVGATSVR